ncbi:MAG: hypothetical protein K5660_09760 [Paludibacteraceae bacterium]|nr:hypothetical protein [Paludibacteraceae bacterium]
MAEGGQYGGSMPLAALTFGRHVDDIRSTDARHLGDLWVTYGEDSAKAGR